MKSFSLTCIILFLPLFTTAAKIDVFPKRKEPTPEPLKSATVVDPSPPSGDGWAWAPINNIKDPHIQELGRFEVKEYNEESKNSLKFESVFKGETEVEAGKYYKLFLKAKDGPLSKICETIVLEKPLKKFRKVTSFVVTS